MSKEMVPASKGQLRGALLAATVVALVMGGLVNAGQLAGIHHGVHTVAGYESFCDYRQGWSCDQVAESRWSVLAGLPVAWWGAIGYLLLGGLALWVARAPDGRRRQAAGTLLIVSAGAVGASASLLAVSMLAIGAACPLCARAHGINLAIAIAAVLVARGAGGVLPSAVTALRFLLERPLRLVALAGAPAALGGLLALSVTPYWHHAAPPLGPEGLSVGVDDDGAHWIGAPEPEVTIVEFTDYQCPHCRRGHEAARRLVSEHPEQVRLVHCNFPLDSGCNAAVRRPFHEQACELACLAHCAGEQDRFWQANDYLFDCDDPRRVTADSLAEGIGLDGSALDACLASERPRRALERDMEEARCAGVRGTPSYVVDGTLHPGGVPEEVVEARLR